MTDLTLGLAVLGVLAVAGVLVYNYVQERSVSKRAARSFTGRQPDALLDEAGERREPTLGRAQAPKPAPRPQNDSLPDERVDYVMLLRIATGMPSAAVLKAWSPIESRFGARSLIAGSGGSGWRRLAPGDFGSCTALRAALQMVSRAGVVSDGELLEFRSAVETLAGRIGAAVSAPEMRAALDAARELDEACAEADIQVALHVIGARLGAEKLAERPFQITPREDGITLTLDLARTPDPARSYEAMARTGRELASAGGRLVDDRGQALDERSLAAIGAELEAVRRTLADRGIEPGSPLALRLFS
jgi:ZipA, C-terminal FtsZ-binding domain